jgi:hypothetical protein
VKRGARLALGVAGSYFLGRNKKMKLVLALTGVATGRRVGGPGQLLAQGTKLLGQSPEVARLTDELRGRLLQAGKGAAVAIATRQVEALTERVVNRVGNLTEAGGQPAGDVGDTAGDGGKKVGAPGRRRSRDDESTDESTEDSAQTREVRSADSGEAEDVRGDAGTDPAQAGEAEPPPPGHGPTRTAAGANGAANTALQRAGGPTRRASKATARRADRPAHRRQGRNNG